MFYKICGTFQGFLITIIYTFADPQDIREVREKVSLRVQGLHRVDLDWKYDQYFVEAQLFHGSRCIGQPVHSHTKKLVEDLKFYPKVAFNQW